MQTEGQQQFRFTWQLGVTIAVCLIALALPIASVLVTVHSLTRGASQQEANPPEPTGSEPLENVLKGIADEKLGPPNLETEVRQWSSLRRTWKKRGGVSKSFSNPWEGLPSRLVRAGPKSGCSREFLKIDLRSLLQHALGKERKLRLGDLVEIVIKKGKEP